LESIGQRKRKFGGIDEMANSDWGITGAFASAEQFKLDDGKRDWILTYLEILNHVDRKKFLERVEFIVTAKMSGDSATASASPGKVRDRLRKVDKLSKSLLKALETLDGYSWDLLARQGRGPSRERPVAEIFGDGTKVFGAKMESVAGYNLNECLHAVATMRIFSTEALKQSADYPSNRITEHSKTQLAIELAKAMRDIVAIQPDNTQSGKFSSCLRWLLEWSGSKPKKGIDPGDRDVRKLVSAALSHLEDTEANFETPR
jgi:hypothetical protein